MRFGRSGLNVDVAISGFNAVCLCKCRGVCLSVEVGMKKRADASQVCLEQKKIYIKAWQKFRKPSLGYYFHFVSIDKRFCMTQNLHIKSDRQKFYAMLEQKNWCMENCFETDSWCTPIEQNPVRFCFLSFKLNQTYSWNNTKLWHGQRSSLIFVCSFFPYRHLLVSLGLLLFHPARARRAPHKPKWKNVPVKSWMTSGCSPARPEEWRRWGGGGPVREEWQLLGRNWLH